MSATSYILSARRSAIGKFGGALRDMPLRAWGSKVAADAIAKAGLDPKDVDEVILGHVLQAGFGPTVARQIAVDAGIPVGSPASVINQVCASGMVAVHHADRMLRCGDARIMLAGGVEQMSAVPYVSHGTRWGSRYGHVELRDEVKHGLTCNLTGLEMGNTAENVARRHNITRVEQDEFALRSQERAAAAIKSRTFVGEIVPVAVPQGRKGEVIFETDEHPRETTAAALAGLKPSFEKNGTVTAGNSSGINDGAAMLVVASEEAVRGRGLKPLARVVATATAGVEPEVMGLGPVPATRRVLEKAGMKLDDIGLFEFNEAFAAQSLGVLREIPVPMEKLNVNGGAIALGHPVGCSGARILVTLLHEMRRRKVRFGLAAMCVGGGMGAATILELSGGA